MVTVQMLGTFLRDETAAGMIEYALLAALIAIASWVAMHNFGKKLAKDYKNLAKKF